MTQPAKAQEPSMEEILASIRRIIADDDAAKPPAKAAPKPAEPAPVKAAAPPPPAPVGAAGRDEMDAMLADLDENPAQAPPEPPDEVLELTEAMAAPPEPPSFRRIDPDQQDVVFDEIAVPPPAPPERLPRSMSSSRSLIGADLLAGDSDRSGLSERSGPRSEPPERPLDPDANVTLPSLSTLSISRQS